jgi:hypothetical protein
VARLTKAQREELRLKFGGKCAYCGCDLSENGWHADHVEPVWREWWKRGTKTVYETVDGKVVSREVKQKVGMGSPERDTIDNMFPACRACNIDKHAMSLETWRGVVAGKVGVCRRNYKAFSHAERFGLVQEISKPVVFWFERYRETQ